MSASVAALEGLLGAEHVAPAGELDRWVVAGVRPEAVVTPGSVEEVVELLRWAAADRVGIVPLGAGSHTGGRAPRAPFVVLSTAGLTGVELYEPADLTVTARAGSALADLGTELGAHAQWLPFDPPGGASRTLGGVLASGHAGPLAAWYGPPRDHLLGATLVTGDGRVLRLGGRVVKNVAGFDLLRPVVGSGGTLGVLVSVCVRVFPVPAAERVLRLRADDATGLVHAARALATAPVLPAAVELHADASGAALTVRLHGAAAQVAAEAETLARAVGASFEDAEAAPADPLAASAAVVRLAALPSRLGELVAAAGAAGPALTADPLAGTVRVGLSAYAEPAGAVALRETAEALGGSLMVERAGGGALAAAASTSGPELAELEAGMRRAFDPDGVLWGGS